MRVSIITTTCANGAEAKKTSDVILKKRLAACIKFSSVESSYWWNGKITRSKETLLTILAPKKNSEKIMGAIRKIHTYDTPEIIETDVKRGDKKYMRWVCEVTE